MRLKRRIDACFWDGIPSLRFRVVHAVWAIVLLAPATLGFAYATQALMLWNPSASTIAPEWHASRLHLAIHLWSAVGIAFAFLAVACTHAVAATSRIFLLQRNPHAVHWMLLLALPLIGAPVLMLLYLPMEDPYTGDGSPTAVLFGIIIYSIPALIMVVPGVALLGSRVFPEQS